MINLTVILEEIPDYLLKGIQEDIEDVQESYHLTADGVINEKIGRMCLDLEINAHSNAMALLNAVDLLDDTGLSPFIIEIGVLK